jgi:signal transduction histidine kinase
MSAMPEPKLTLQHADRLNALGLLAAAVAHELGTPLNVVQLRASMIANREVKGEGAENCARIIEAEVERMAKLTRMLLDYAHPPKSARAMQSLKAVVDRVLALLSPFARRKAIRLAASGEDVLVDIDGAQIQQVLTNLIMNAIHATPAEGSIEITIASANPWAVLRVRDDGCGIEQKDLSRVFEPFFTTKSEGEGTGLGLTVAGEIVREHGGFIGVESRVGEGSEFTVHLPVRGT